MPSSSDIQDLLDKVRALPEDKIAAVADFLDFLRMKQQRAAATLDERLHAAVEAGLIAPPAAGAERSSVRDVPPVAVPGKPASEMVIEDRR